MKELLSVISVPVFALLSYLLGHVFGRKKTIAELEKVKLDNAQQIVAFYKETFNDLEKQLKNVVEKCRALSEEIELLRKENGVLKSNIRQLNQQLLKNQTYNENK